MNRWGLTHLVVVALLVGSALEIIKRFKFKPSPTEEISAELQKPYARKDFDLSQSKSINHARRTAQPAFKPAARFTRDLLIPATEGKFEATTPKTIAGVTQKGQNKVDDKKAKAKSDKCRKKKSAEEIAKEMEAVKDLPPEVQLQLAQAKANLAKALPEKQKEEVECEDEEVVAKKDDEKPAETKPEQEEPPAVDQQNLPTPIYGGNDVAPYPKNGELAGLEEWKARVLDKPDFQETVRLIEAVQSGQLNAATFYAIVQLMLADNRQDMRILGVLAAGRTPSYESFHLLVSVVKKETYGSAVRVKAEGELGFYKQIGQLSIMDRVLKNSTDIFAVIWAIKTVDASANIYLASGKYDRDGKNPYAARFKNIVASLKLLTNPGHDPEQISRARQTLSLLESLLLKYA